jgi:hypothetical protein
MDRGALVERMQAYFDKGVSNEDVAALHPALMMTGNRIVGPQARIKLIGESRYDESRIVRYPFKPFDVRWCYLDNIRPLFSESSPQLLRQYVPGSKFLVLRESSVSVPDCPPMMFSRLVYGKGPSPHGPDCFTAIFGRQLPERDPDDLSLDKAIGMANGRRERYGG